MGLLNLKEVSSFEVEEYLINNIPELTKYQIQRIKDDEVIRFAPFRFFKHKTENTNILWRLTLPFYFFIYCTLVLSLPFNFILTGKWGYSKIKWYRVWTQKLGMYL